MTGFEAFLKGIVIILVVYVIAKVALGVIGLFGYLIKFRNYLNGIPFLNALILVVFALIAIYYVFVKK